MGRHVSRRRAAAPVQQYVVRILFMVALLSLLRLFYLLNSRHLQLKLGSHRLEKTQKTPIQSIHLTSVFMIVPGMGDGLERQSIVKKNIEYISEQVRSLNLPFRCMINVFGKKAKSETDFLPCALEATGLGVEEVQRDTKSRSGEAVIVLFDDVAMQSDHPVDFPTLFTNMREHSLDIANPACDGTGWDVMKPGSGLILAKFYEPFVTVYTSRAWACRQKLLRIILSFSNYSNVMEWDKYEFSFCHSRIGIFKEMVARHTEAGGKTESLVSVQGSQRIDWIGLYDFMLQEHGLLPINADEKREITHSSAGFLEIAHGNGYDKLTLI